VYFPEARAHALAETSAALRWRESPRGQHIELGIAEHNLFLLLGALGLTGELAGEPLAAIGTLYDPFVSRGLDALYHALYSGSRFIVVATPSGVSLAPEGGAHQSVITPPIGVALPAMVYYEPVFAREVEWLLLEWVERLLAGDPELESLYLRLTTAMVDQALAPRHAEHRADALAGGYRLVDGTRAPDWDPEANAVHLFAAGILVPEAVEAARQLEARGVRASVFAVTSPDRLYRGLRAGAPARARWLERLVRPDEEGVPVVSAIDGHSQALAFIGSALGVPQVPLGVDDFGQSGTRPDLYAHYRIDATAMVRSALLLLGEREG
jgi:pyruvate dehydrogenase E1 component